MENNPFYGYYISLHFPLHIIETHTCVEWEVVSTRLDLDEDFMERHLDKLNSSIISLKELSIDFIKRNIEKLHVNYLMINEYIDGNYRVEIAREYKESIDWELLSRLINTNNTHLLEHLKDYLLWDLISYRKIKNLSFFYKMYKSGYFKPYYNSESYMFILYCKLANTQTIENNERCSICFVEEGEKVTLSCHRTHSFHLECLEYYLMEKNINCPICRADIQIFE